MIQYTVYDEWWKNWRSLGKWSQSFSNMLIWIIPVFMGCFYKQPFPSAVCPRCSQCQSSLSSPSSSSLTCCIVDNKLIRNNPSYHNQMITWLTNACVKNHPDIGGIQIGNLPYHVQLLYLFGHHAQRKDTYIWFPNLFYHNFFMLNNRMWRRSDHAIGDVLQSKLSRTLCPQETLFVDNPCGIWTKNHSSLQWLRLGRTGEVLSLRRCLGNVPFQ